MNNKLKLVEKAVEIFGVSVEVDRMNDKMTDLIFSDTPDNVQLTLLQDQLFEKRVELKKLEKEYEEIKTNGIS